jgi:ankyrin repeat protein
VDLNVADKDGGLTPLHLAVISGNTRIVRKLLVRGANRKIRDKQNKLPIDLAIENEFVNIEKMLVSMNNIY